MKVKITEEAKTIATKFVRHEDNRFSDFDKRQKAYWTDMYEKLTVSKEQVVNIVKF